MTTLGYTHTEETRAKLSAKMKGRKRSPDSIEKIKRSLRGKPKSSSQRKAISDGLKKYWQSRSDDERSLKGKQMSDAKSKKRGSDD